MNLAEPVSLVSTASPVLRPLGSFEKLFFLLDQHRPIHFALAAQVKGRTSIATWSEALDSLQRRHPLLSVCIETNDESVPHFRRVENVPIPLRVIHRSDACSDWESEIELELSFPFNPGQAPLLRAVLLHQRERATCILVAHHSIADGRSVTFLIRDLLLALSGTSLEGLPLLPAHEDILGIPLKEAGKPVPNGSESGSTVVPAVHINEGLARPRITTLQLTPEFTGKLRKRARDEGTTVHGALSSAFALAYWEVVDEMRSAPVNVCSPIDTRKMLGLGEDCGLLIDAGRVTIEPESATTFWEIARNATARLAKVQTLEAIAGMRNRLYQALAGCSDIPTAAAFVAEGFAHQILLTNLGNLPYPTDFGNVKLEAVWGPAASARIEGGETVGVATCNGALNLLHTSFRSNDLLETAQEMLSTACATRKAVLLS